MQGKSRVEAWFLPTLLPTTFLISARYKESSRGSKVFMKNIKLETQISKQRIK